MVLVTEAAVFLVFVVGIGAILVKVYERRQDVLYGPYHSPSPERKQYNDKF
jgi:hypothetical protein